MNPEELETLITVAKLAAGVCAFWIYMYFNHTGKGPGS